MYRSSKDLRKSLQGPNPTEDSAGKLRAFRHDFDNLKSTPAKPRGTPAKNTPGKRKGKEIQGEDGLKANLAIPVISTATPQSAKPVAGDESNLRSFQGYNPDINALIRRWLRPDQARSTANDYPGNICPIYTVHESCWKPFFFDHLGFTDLYNFVRSSRRAYVAWKNIDSQVLVGMDPNTGHGTYTFPKSDILWRSMELEDMQFMKRRLDGTPGQALSPATTYNNIVKSMIGPYSYLPKTNCCSDRKYAIGTRGTAHTFQSTCKGCPWRDLHNYLSKRGIEFPEQLSRCLWILALEHRAHNELQNADGFVYIDKYQYLQNMGLTRLTWLWLKLRQVDNILSHETGNGTNFLSRPGPDELYFGLTMGWRQWLQIKEMYFKEQEEEEKKDNENAGVGDADCDFHQTSKKAEHLYEAFHGQEVMWMEHFMVRNAGIDTLKIHNWIRWMDEWRQGNDPWPGNVDKESLVPAGLQVEDLADLLDLIERTLQSRLMVCEKSLREIAEDLTLVLNPYVLLIRRLKEARMRLHWFTNQLWYDFDGDKKGFMQVPQIPTFML